MCGICISAQAGKHKQGRVAFLLGKPQSFRTRAAALPSGGLLRYRERSRAPAAAPSYLAARHTGPRRIHWTGVITLGQHAEQTLPAAAICSTAAPFVFLGSCPTSHVSHNATTPKLQTALPRIAPTPRRGTPLPTAEQETTKRDAYRSKFQFGHVSEMQLPGCVGVQL